MVILFANLGKLREFPNQETNCFECSYFFNFKIETEEGEQDEGRGKGWREGSKIYSNNNVRQQLTVKYPHLCIPP